MKYFFAIVWLFFFALSCQHKDYQNVAELKEHKTLLLKNYALLCQKTSALNSLNLNSQTLPKARHFFKESRLAYKKVESLLTFYFPETTSKINGAAIDKNEVLETSRKVEEATGYQKVEELLFSDVVDFAELKVQIGTLNGYIHTLKVNVANLDLTDSNIFEAQKLELIRILSHSISGYDSPIALYSLPEAVAMLESIQDNVSLYTKDDSFLKTTRKAITYLQQHHDFNTFDRAEFILHYGIPLAKKLGAIQKELNIKNNKTLGAINFDTTTMFEENGINSSYFAPSYNKNPSLAQIKLGEQLFKDPILSGDNTISCLQCHVPSMGYADHQKTALLHKPSRNTPTLLNAGFQNVLFLDGRVNYLEDQAKAVISNKDEMHGNFSKALLKIKSNKMYQAAFRKAFPKETAITELNLLKSLASYIRTLSVLDSKFDRYLRGQKTLSTNEIRGFNLFMGKGKCATCHFFPLFNGSIPPLYEEIESEVLGVPQTNQLQNASVDTDLGEFVSTQSPLKKYAFRTPTVRNSALTYPYMHNGVFQTLEDVLTFYNKGGGNGIGIHLENQTLSKDELHLTPEEIKDMIAFIKTLNNSKY